MPYKGNWKINLDNGLETALGDLDSLQASYVTSKKKKPVKKKLKNKHKGGEFEYDWPKCMCGMAHPPVPGFKAPDGVRCTFYWQLADMFPLMTLHRVLTSEIRFIEADKDQSGVLDVDEVVHLLQHLVGSDLKASEIQKLFKQLDEDKSGTLDFTEVLWVIDDIIQRRSMDNIDEPIAKELSKVCSVQ